MVSSINRFVRNSILDKFECERDSSRDLSSTRYTNKVIVPNDKEVTYRVEYAGYVTQEQTAIYENDTKLDIKLELPKYKLTINPTPSDATVVLTASGFTQVGNSIEVTEGTTVTYTVSKNKYTPKSGSVIMSNVEKTVDVSLTKENYTITINPTPSTATVTLTASGYTQSGNSITVPADTVVDYSVSADKHITQTGAITADKTKSVSVELVKLITITVNPIPSDATVTLRAPDMPEYTQSGNSITIPSTTYAQFYVDREGYQSKNGGWLSNQFSEDHTATIELTPLNYTLSVTPTPSDATVTLTAAGYTQSGNSITVPYTTNVSYEVAKTHYGTKTGTKSVTKDENINVSLTKNQYTITVNPTPSNATVSLTATGFAQSGNSITVDALTTVNYTVSASKYVSKSGTITADNSKTVDVSLAKETYKLTVNPTPSDATVTLTASGYTQSGNSITVPADTSVAYSITKTGYASQSGNVVVDTANKTLNVTLVSVQTEPEIITATTTKTLDAGTYRYIVVGAGGGGGRGVGVAFSRAYDIRGAGGGGSGYAKVGTFTTTGESVTFTVGSGGVTSSTASGIATDGGASSIKGSKLGTIATANGGIGGSGSQGGAPYGNGGNGGSGGGAGGYSSRSGNNTYSAGGPGGIGGYNGITYSDRPAGTGARNTTGSHASNGGAVGSGYSTQTFGGQGLISAKSQLSTSNGFDTIAADVYNVYGYMAGGGGGAGTNGTQYTCGGAGGGGGGWTAGTDSTESTAGSGNFTVGGTGGSGAIIYRRIA